MIPDVRSTVRKSPPPVGKVHAEGVSTDQEVIRAGSQMPHTRPGTISDRRGEVAMALAMDNGAMGSQARPIVDRVGEEGAEQSASVGASAAGMARRGVRWLTSSSLARRRYVGLATARLIHFGRNKLNEPRAEVS